MVLVQFGKTETLVCRNGVLVGWPLSEPVEEIRAVQDLDVRATDVDVDLSAGVFAVAVAVAVAAEEVAGARAAAENGLFAAALALSD